MDKKYLIFMIIISLVFLCMNKSKESFSVPTNNQINLSNDQKTQIQNYLTNEINDIVPGVIVAINSSNVPTGWVLCNGTNKWYDSSGTEQTTPDLQGRFLLGAGEGDGLTNRVLNTKGGNKEHTLTIAQLPKHVHKGRTGKLDPTNNTWTDDGEHDHTYEKPDQKTGAACVKDERKWFYSDTKSTYTSKGAHKHDFTTESIGGGEPFNIMPPYFVVTYIIKSGPIPTPSGR